MEPDFTGYCTRTGIRCTDGRTIKHHAFKGNDNTTVPLVWQHLHDSPENVLGHVVLHSIGDGVRAEGFFNDSVPAMQAKTLVKHGDIKMLSIYANQLIQQAMEVVHGVIREVSLVLSGANPGAYIDNVNLAHGDGITPLADEAIIYTDAPIELAQVSPPIPVASLPPKPALAHAVSGLPALMPPPATAQASDGGPSVADVIAGFTEEQRNVVYALIGAAMSQSDPSGPNPTDPKGEPPVTRNVFDQSGGNAPAAGPVLSHADMQGIFEDARKHGSLKEAVQSYALAHGIQNIDLLFPDAQAVDATPAWITRRQAWVANVLGNTHHTPFSRIKSRFADITLDEARARGYVKGAMKREEFFGITTRITTPKTIYKKQKLDRDDILDITEFSVVDWMKTEMRVMLDEEVARAILVGDGRDVADPDKINENNIRPILTDADLFVTRVNINLSDASSSNEEIVDGIMSGMQYYQGTGVPTLYTARSWVTKMLLTKDTLGRRLHSSVAELSDAMGVGGIVMVDILESMTSSLIGIIVNLQDYSVGTDRGGEVTFFDDFDIDYNQFKYLYETRLSGALVQYKSAIVVGLTTATMLGAPTAPTFVKATGVVTIPTMANVSYVSVNDQTGVESAALTAGAQTAIAAGASSHIRAKAASGYSFADNASNNWTFQRPAS
jgi:Phage capsid family